MSETEGVGIEEKNQTVFVPVEAWSIYDVPTFSISMHLIIKAEQDREGSGSSP